MENQADGSSPSKTSLILQRKVSYSKGNRMNIENLDGVIKAGICGGDYIIPAKHFHLCPLDSLKKENFSKNQWSLSYGGSPLKIMKPP